MNIKTIALMTTAFSLFAVEAYAQANHNTSRSNKTAGGIAAPADTATEGDEDRLKENLDLKVTGIGNGNTANGYQALSADTSGIGNTANGYQALSLSKGKDGTGHVTLIKSAPESGSDNAATGCVMFNGAADANCDGVADKPDLDDSDISTKIDPPKKPRRPRNIYQRRNY